MFNGVGFFTGRHAMESSRRCPPRSTKAARDLIEQHGIRAAYFAAERLNDSIDRRDKIGRDFWAQVVHAIHEHQRIVKEHKARSGRRAKKRSFVLASAPLRRDT